ncbi:hypothetical protein [Streptomyces sp. NBC_00470]|uniref:hypothetical protein n=1 Tax=Streptomyces sp. NBC_00470 TaxID=2975753 RepID=UPI0030E08076
MTDNNTLAYWAVLFIKGTEGSCTVAVTDGDYTPHNEETVRKIIETRYGKVDRMSAVGPMTDDNAHHYIRSASATPEGFDAWVKLAK